MEDMSKLLKIPNKYYLEYKGGSSRNAYRGPMERVAEISQNEFGLTTANDEKPVLATYGLLNCVSISGYEHERKIAFLTHYQSNTDLDLAFGVLLYNISRITHSEHSLFKTKICGGLNGMSERLVNGLRRKLEGEPSLNINFELVEENILGSEIKGRDLVIDASSGHFYDKYDPLSNPYRREPYPQWIKEMIFMSKLPKLSYFPKDFDG